MRRALFCLVVMVAAMYSRESSGHDLVTTPARPGPWNPAPSPPSVDAEQLAPTAAGRRSASWLLDLRTAWGVPLGEARGFATGRTAADVAIGYLTGSGRYAGVTAGASTLDSSLSDFHETTFQLGVDLAFRPPLQGRVEPWIGLGFAWQILWLTRGDFYMKAVGPEFPIVRIGVDYRLGDQVALGPFAAFAYRRYDPFSVEGQTPVELSAISGRDGWLALGISATLGPAPH